jgi:hypothetical protein
MGKIPRVLFAAILFIISISYSQSFTGGLRIIGQYTSYPQNSMVLGDSISDSDYSVSGQVPGFSQTIALNAFGRIGKGNSSIILEMNNDSWTSLWNYPEQKLQRFTFEWKTKDLDVTVGDFYKNGIDVFIASRPVRGVRVQSNLGKEKTPWVVDVYGGQLAAPKNYGGRLSNQYKTYENGGVFRRLGAALEVTKKWDGFIETKIEGMWAKDLENSIDKSTVKPLQNLIGGITVNSFLLSGKLNIGLGYWASKLDSMAYATIQDESFVVDPDDPSQKLDSLKTASGNDFTTKLWVNYNWESGKGDFQLYRIGSNYYSAGNPYLLRDKTGGLLSLKQEIFASSLFAVLESETFSDNLDDNPLYPHTSTYRFNPKIIYKISGFDITLSYPWQNEQSDTLFQDAIPTLISRTTSGPEVEINYSLGGFSLNYSAYFSSVDENSLIYGDSLFSNDQQIHNLNLFYSNDRFMLSLGSAASIFSGGGTTSGFASMGVYGNSRIKIVPGKFVVEVNGSYQKNNVDYINVWEKVGSFREIKASSYFEYFFTYSLSLKAGIEYINRDYDYTADDVRTILQLDGFDYMYFNGQEDLNLLRPSVEMNILF